MNKLRSVTIIIPYFFFALCAGFDLNKEGSGESGVINIPKCCPNGTNVVLISNGNEAVAVDCRNSSGSNIWTGYFYDKNSLQPIPKATMNASKFRYNHNILSCNKYESIQPSFTSLNNHSVDIKLLSDGTVVRYCRRCPCKKWQPVAKEYCIDGLGKPISETDQLVGYCPEQNAVPGITARLYIWVTFSSSVFYLITAVVYALLWETQNLPGWTTFSLVLSRFLMCIFLGTAYLATLNRSLENTFMCTAIGVSGHFFMLSSFTWLSVINFDFWWTFRTLRPRSEQSGYLARLLTYQALGWGFPALIVSISLIMDSTYRDTDVEIRIPDYGNGICFVTPCSRGVYVYFILAGLLAMSLVFSMLTFSIIYKLRKNTERIRVSKNTVDTKGYILYAKLSVVMGTTWVFEFLSWAAAGDGNYDQNWIWGIIDIFNLLISAILIFIIFICKRKITAQLEQKYQTFQVVASFVRDLLKSIPEVRTNWFIRPSEISSNTADADIPSTDATSLPLTSTNKSYSSMGNQKQ